MAMTSDASDTLESLGADPFGSEVDPADTSVLRRRLSGADVRLIFPAQVDDPERDVPDEVWRFRDGSYLLRFGRLWQATGINGVDPVGARWSALYA